MTSSTTLATAADSSLADRISALSGTVGAVGSGLTAGVMLAFSVSVMPGLRTLQPSAGIAAMQSANVAILGPAFLSVLGGATVACAVTGISSCFTTGGPNLLRVGGAVAFLAGCIAVTAAVNVPLNDALAAVDPASSAGAQVWADYLSRWTSWNHLRTVAGAAACIALTVASRVP